MIEERLNQCEESKQDSVILLKEKKSVYRLINSNNDRISIYEIDGCVYDAGSRETRCDYLLNTGDKLFFIELKGINVRKGLNQILTSIRKLKQYFNYDSINARIVTTRGQKPKRLNTFKEYRDLVKLIGTRGVVLKNSPFEEKIN